MASAALRAEPIRAAAALPPYYLEAEKITQRYPGVVTLDGVRLAIRPGTAHALMGENGAGKSTLMKVLAGIVLVPALDHDGDRRARRFACQALAEAFDPIDMGA